MTVQPFTAGPPGGAAVQASARLRRLTERERQVPLAIGRGLTNREIADQLTVSESAVKGHARNVLGKIGARAHAVIIAYEAGLVRSRR